MELKRKSYSVSEIAERHRFSPAFVYKQIAAGHLHARKAGRTTRITDTDEASWLKSMPRMRSGNSDKAA
jgi:excisionase family DNA binding protein